MVQITEEQGEVEINLRIIECSEHTDCVSVQILQAVFFHQQNLHVSFDFEHWEDFEDKSPFPIGKQ